MKILISDKTDPIAASILKENGHEVDEITDLSPEELKNVIGKYDGLIVRSGTKVTRDIIEAASNLKVIGRAGSGVDNIDIQAATEKKIVVMNTPGANTNGVVELTLGYIFALNRNLYNASHSLKQGKWEKKKFKGTEALGKTLGVIGYGRIGRQVAIKAKCLGMEVLCYDPVVGRNIIDQFGVKLVKNFDELLESADIISIHVPLNDVTRNMMNKEVFMKMKRGVKLIHCARGGIINEKDLLWALNEGIVSMAGLDVFEQEPPENLELVQHPNVICTPHLGASTVESQRNTAEMIAKQFVEFFEGKGATNQVNPF
jgi:D-3-phosphoglycerate dehydrogenase